MTAPTEPQTPPPAEPPPPPADPAQGFPSGVSLDQMTDAQQAAYWKHYARKHEDTVKSMGDYQALRDKAGEYERLLASTQTDQEKALAKAKDEGKAEGITEAGTKVARAEFKAAAKGVLSDQQLAALLEDRDLTKYLTPTGDPDEAKIAKIVTDAAPAAGQQQHVTLGQGRKPADAKPTVSSGREMYENSRKKRPATT